MAQQDPSGSAPADVARLSYEQARDELVDVVRRLESGAAPLEASLALWERGEALADRCQEVLDGARARLDARVAGRAGGDTPEDRAPSGPGAADAARGEGEEAAPTPAPAPGRDDADAADDEDRPLDPRIPVRRRPAGDAGA